MSVRPHIMRTGFWIAVAWAIALILTACSPSGESVNVDGGGPEPATVAAAQGMDTVTPTETRPALARVGNAVGDRVPQFEFSLADGAKVTSADLVMQRKPVYLFFFARW